MLSKIKEEYKSTFIAYGGKGALPLGMRDDLDKLAVMAHESGSKSLKKLFEVLPPLDKLKESLLDSKMQGLKPSAEIPAAKPDAKKDDIK